MSEHKQGDGAAATPGARDADVAHDTRSAHSLEPSGYQDPARDESADASVKGGEPRRKPGDGKKDASR